MNIPIIGFHGPKKSGKTFIAQHLAKMLIEEQHRQVILLGFADQLKEELSIATGIGREEMETNKDSFRELLQFWGTQFRRDYCDKDYWVKAWLKKVNNIQSFIPGIIIIAHDVRFDNETMCIAKEGGSVYRVVTVNSPHLYNDDKHESEMPLLLDMPTIINDFKNNKQLREQLEQLIKV